MYPRCITCIGSTPDLCIENAQGHAGDVIDVPVVLIATAACKDELLEASGHLVLDEKSFELANPVEQVQCITRDVFMTPAKPSTTEISWSAFGGGAIAACPGNLVPGKVDVASPGTTPASRARGGVRQLRKRPRGYDPRSPVSARRHVGHLAVRSLLN